MYKLEVLALYLHRQKDYQSLQSIYALIIFFIPSYKVEPIFIGTEQKCDRHSNFKMAITSNTYQSPWVAWRLQIFMTKHGYYSQNKGC